MTKKRLESLMELMILQDKVGRFFENDRSIASSKGGTWTPPADIYETADSIIIVLELPEVGPKDVRIELSDNYITIQGQRPFKGREENYLCVERSYGPFQRTFRLPAMVEENNVRAEFKYGVLKILMAKVKGPDPEYVRVKIN